ncbi:phthiocerol/phthiodiolone dimycocerosyl transferase family protein [Nocardia caishijiensis]|uniref:Phthiocerol/phthiodiolone dimycocerosyl transferase n=1 Tax=Nocardia caishijiensis TaxID=184756 RepID=A0ABQ6YKI0_9NOCA|nr:hypothetical protein [Nocardia caishijiensis]KAF0846293.1 condensation domain-containing protein [Nocardia caishijiensis]
MRTDSVERALSASERWFWLVDQLSPANCVVRIRVRGAIGAYRLESAAEALVAEFPLLRSVVGAGPCFVASADPHLPVLHRIVGDLDDWRTVFDTQLATPVDLATSPGRIVDLAFRPGTEDEQHDLIVVFSHVYLDGRSMVALVWRLLAYAFGAEPVVATRSAIPAPDDLIPPAQTRMVRCLWTNVAGQLRAVARRAVSLPGVPPPLGMRRTRTVVRTITGDLLAGLRSRCHRESVTVSALLAAALAEAIGDYAPRDSGVVGMGVPVDIRSRLNPPPAEDEPGMFTAVVPTFVPFGTDLPSAARSAKAQLDKGIARHTDLRALAAIRYGCPRTLESGRRTIELIDRRAPWNVTLSNLGRITPPRPPEPLHIADVTVAGTNSCASALTVGVATFDNTLSITFCYVDTMVPRATIEALADTMIATATA